MRRSLLDGSLDKASCSGGASYACIACATIVRGRSGESRSQLIFEIGDIFHAYRKPDQSITDA